MIAIIALGQELRGDDGAGLEVVRAWQRAYPSSAALPSIRVEYAGLAGLGLLNWLEGVDHAILVDAVKTTAPSGTLFTLKESDLASFNSGSAFAHGWGVAETLALGRRMGVLEDSLDITLIAVCAAEFTPGVGLSLQVQRALPEATIMLENLVQKFLQT